MSYLGRFISADTIIASLANPQSLNRYSYVYNNPINNTDPTGHRPCDGEYGCSADPQQRSKPTKHTTNTNKPGGSNKPANEVKSTKDAQGNHHHGRTAVEVGYVTQEYALENDIPISGGLWTSDWSRMYKFHFEYWQVMYLSGGLRQATRGTTFEEGLSAGVDQNLPIPVISTVNALNRGTFDVILDRIDEAVINQKTRNGYQDMDITVVVVTYVHDAGYREGGPVAPARDALFVVDTDGYPTRVSDLLNLWRGQIFDAFTEVIANHPVPK